MIKVATCQYVIEQLVDWSAYTTKAEALVSQAAQMGAQLLLLPEYAGIEIACDTHASDESLYAAIQDKIPHYKNLYQQLAQQYQLYIQSGTVIEKNHANRYVNRGYFFGPQGLLGYQDKQRLIEYEKSSALLQAGQQQMLFDTALGKIGIVICYDSEFPEIVTPLVQAGAQLILVPSYTSSLAGFHRVYLSCRARAIENQCYVMTSCVVGSVKLSLPIEKATGRAAILGPADDGFADDGLLAEGNYNIAQILTADLDLTKLSWVRQHGQVHNFLDRQIQNKKRSIKIIK